MTFVQISVVDGLTLTMVVGGVVRHIIMLNRHGDGGIVHGVGTRRVQGLSPIIE